ncbi:MAG TPA: ParB/RepB/Spo0J family partition protein [Bacteroidia bacterium]|nr:ParB/RepB/Spo0J family partition protein [Bacteroidia bacterium]
MSNNNFKKRALGKGLSALLQDNKTDITSSNAVTEVASGVVGSVAMLQISQIETNPFQPRTHFEEVALQELADSIALHGIIQPVTVRKLGYDKYQLISGERRFRASQLAGLTEVPAYIRIANDQAMLEMALVENVQRENLDAIEIAISYKRLIDECNLTQEAVSEKVSKQRSTVTNYLRLLKLPDDIQLGLRDQKISMGHARALINIENKETQVAIFNTIIEQDLSVRDTEELVRETAKGSAENIDLIVKPASKTGVNTSTDVNLSKELKVIFNKHAELKRSSNGKGKIVLPFYSEEEMKLFLNRLFK